MATDAMVGTPDDFLQGARVILHKGNPAFGDVTARDGTEIYRTCCIVGDLKGQLKQTGCMDVHALATGGARKKCAFTEWAANNGIAPKIIDGLEVVIALYQQAQVKLQNTAVGHTNDWNWKSAFNAIANTQASDTLPNRRRSGVGGEDTGLLYDTKVGLAGTHFLGEVQFSP